MSRGAQAPHVPAASVRRARKARVRWRWHQGVAFTCRAVGRAPRTPSTSDPVGVARPRSADALQAAETGALALEPLPERVHRRLGVRKCGV